MQPSDLAKAYMRIIYEDGEMEALRSILADELKFEGPFFSCSNAGEYVEVMKKDPPVGFDYQILKEYEDDNSACLVYRFFKPGVETIMAQVFEVEHGKIKQIKLIFDSGVFL